MAESRNDTTPLDTKLSHGATRRHFLTDAFRGVCLAGLGGVAAFLLNRTRKTNTVWQIDPYKCVACTGVRSIVCWKSRR